MRLVLAPLLLLAAVGALGAAAGEDGHEHASAGGSAAARFEPPAPGTYDLPPIVWVHEHRLLDPGGSAAPLLGLAEGQAAIVSFVYLSCGDACPRATAVLQQLDLRIAAEPGLAGRVRLVTVSFDPARDTPQAMGELARALRPRSDWRFLTARNAAQIRPVLADFGQDQAPELAANGDPTGRLHHVLRVFLVDADGAVRNVYSTGFLDARVLRNDLLTVLSPPAK